MTRSRWILIVVALFAAWTLFVGWIAARWGATRARGSLAQPFHETAGGGEQLVRPDVTLVAVERPDIRGPGRDLEPEYSTCCSIGRDRKVHVESKRLENEGLQVQVDDFDGFYGETTTIDLIHGEGGDVLARVEVSGFSDFGPLEWTWKHPGGWIFVSRRDWSNLSTENPMLVRFHLYDGESPLTRCARGFVRIPE